MTFFFHGKKNLELGGGGAVRALALARLEARVGFVNDVDAALAAHDLAIRVAGFERLDGGGDFHSWVGPGIYGKTDIRPEIGCGVNGKGVLLQATDPDEC